MKAISFLLPAFLFTPLIATAIALAKVMAITKATNA
jgi:hypothetical protein